MTKSLYKTKYSKAAVLGIIVKNSRIFLTKRSSNILEGNKWCLPGGCIDFGESTEKAIRREIKEEIGLNVKESKFLFYFDEIIQKKGLHHVILVFLIKAFGKLKPNWEVSETGWFSEKEVESLNMAAKHKNVIKRFFKEEK